MTVINPLSGSGVVRAGRAGRPGGGASGFMVGRAATAAQPAPATAVGLDGLLAAQERAVETTRDRAARRHGQTMLRLLAELQRGLLGDGGATPALDHLAALAASTPAADDPDLAGLLRACGLRAAVELARRGL